MNCFSHFPVPCRQALKLVVWITGMACLVANGSCVLKDEIGPSDTSPLTADSLFARSQATLLVMQGHNRVVIRDEAGSQTFMQIIPGEEKNRLRLFAGTLPGPFLLLESPELIPFGESVTPSLFAEGALSVSGWKLFYRSNRTSGEPFEGKEPTEPLEISVLKTIAIPGGFRVWIRCIDPQQSSDTLRLLIPVREI